MLSAIFRNPTVRAVVVLLLLSVAFYTVFLRRMYYRPGALERSAVGAAWTTTGFSVAVVWPPHTDASLIQGVQLAWEETNAAGGLLANKIRLRFFTETDDAGALARDIARVRDVVAVIGHEIADNVIPASLTYEQHGILFLSPKSTNRRLTTHGFTYTFRLTDDDGIMTSDMAVFAAEQNWKRIGILYGQNEHGVAASGLFLTRARADGIDVPFYESYLGAADWETQDHRLQLAEIRRRNFDAIMLADELPWAGKLLLDMSSIGITQPILATDKLDSIEVWNIAKDAANNLYVASSVDPDSKEPAYIAFKQKFHERFGVDPGYGSAQGYESFKLFVSACEKSSSADPIAVATTIRTNTWPGLFGDFAFTASGDVIGRDVSIKRMQFGRFVTVHTIEEDVN